MKNTEHRSFIQLFLKEEPVLRAFFWSATGRAEAVDDLLQETAAVLWGKWDEFDRSKPFRRWSLGIAKLEVLKWRQRLARSKESLSEEAVERLSEAAQEHAEEVDRRHLFLTECLQSLSESCWSVLNMKYGQNMHIAGIADRLEKSVAAVEMILVRTRRALRDCIDRKITQAEGGQ